MPTTSARQSLPRPSASFRTAAAIWAAQHLNRTSTQVLVWVHDGLHIQQLCEGAVQLLKHLVCQADGIGASNTSGVLP